MLTAVGAAIALNAIVALARRDGLQQNEVLFVQRRSFVFLREVVMFSTRRFMLTAVAAGAFATSAALSPAFAADLAAPGPVTGTITLSAQGAAAGVGYTWGDGILTFHGRKYHFTVNGVSIADVGYSKVTGSGRVYHLKSVNDFSGTYAASTGQATAGNSGIGGQILENASGVQIRVDQVSRGARLQGSVDGIKLTLK